MLRIITSSKVIPYAVRAISYRGSSLSGSITNAFKGCSVEDYMAISRDFCTNQNSIVPLAISPTEIVPLAISPTEITPLAIDEIKKPIDGNLLEVFNSEIKLKQTPNDAADDMAATATIPIPIPIPIPDEFPFTIKDNPWERHVTLSRVFHGEKIDVSVDMPYIKDDKSSSSDSDTSDSDDDSDFSSSDDDDSDEEKERRDKTEPLKMTMKVSKQDGKLSDIRFSVSTKQIDMYWVDLQQQYAQAGKGTHELLTHYLYSCKKNMKSGFVEFLKVRGIDTSIHGFLYSYMVNKNKKCPVAKLEKLRDFFAN